MRKDMTYLYTRNHVYYFRRRVPSDLVEVIEPNQFHFSLGTKDYREAISRRSPAIAESDLTISKERERLKQPPQSSPVVIKGGPKGGAVEYRRRQRLLKAQSEKRRRTRAFCQYQESDILNLVAGWYRKSARETEDAYRDSFALNNAEDREEIEQDLDQEWRYLTGQLEPMDELIGFRAVRAILDEEDCALPSDCLQDPLFRKFYSLVREGLLRLNQIASSLVKTGRLPESSNGNFPDISTLAFSGTATTSITLDELIDRFDKCPRRQHLREATRKEYPLIYRVLREHINGDTPIHLIKREMILGVAETLRTVPSRATLTAPKTPLRQLAADAKARGLPPPPAKTYNKKVQQISAIFGYAVTEQLLTQNPAMKLSLPEPLTSGEDKGFTTDQLSTIFSGDFFSQFLAEPGSQFVPNHPLRPCYFWSPLIALHQGFRSGEILQLNAANVCERDGVMALKIEGAVKNQPTIRWVPLHPRLIDFGFVRYVENVKKHGHERVFPDAKKGSDGKYSTWFQRPWANYLRRIGVKTSRKECFHALRHTWNEAARRADVREEIQERLGGWKTPGSSVRDYGRYPLEWLLKYLKRVEYPGLDLTALRPK
jgi:hypothetical protein